MRSMTQLTSPLLTDVDRTTTPMPVTVRAAESFLTRLTAER